MFEDYAKKITNLLTGSKDEREPVEDVVVGKPFHRLPFVNKNVGRPCGSPVLHLYGKDSVTSQSHTVTNYDTDPACQRIAGGDKHLEIWLYWIKTPSHDAYHTNFEDRCMSRKHISQMIKMDPETNHVLMNFTALKYILNNVICVQRYLSTLIQPETMLFREYQKYDDKSSPNDVLHSYARAVTVGRALKSDGRYFLPPPIKNFIKDGYFANRERWYKTYPELIEIMSNL